jgi:hypothetical protein
MKYTGKHTRERKKEGSLEIWPRLDSNNEEGLPKKRRSYILERAK